MLNWKLIDTGARSAAANMELDAALLADLKDEQEAILHLYAWEGDAATYGHFVDPATYLNLDGVAQKGLDLAKRPTGGGIIFHTCDLAFSVLVPATHPAFSSVPLENYAFVNSRVSAAIETMGALPATLLPEEPTPLDAHCERFCMAKPTKYDVMIEGRKVGGAAQRTTRHGFLHQGSISLGMPSEAYLEAILAPDTQVLEGMQAHSYPLLGGEWTPQQLEEARQQLRHALKHVFLGES